jgi:hypothetical protein
MQILVRTQQWWILLAASRSFFPLLPSNRTLFASDDTITPKTERTLNPFATIQILTTQNCTDFAGPVFVRPTMGCCFVPITRLPKFFV